MDAIVTRIRNEVRTTDGILQEIYAPLIDTKLTLTKNSGEKLTAQLLPHERNQKVLIFSDCQSNESVGWIAVSCFYKARAVVAGVEIKLPDELCSAESASALLTHLSNARGFKRLGDVLFLTPEFEAATRRFDVKAFHAATPLEKLFLQDPPGQGTWGAFANDPRPIVGFGQSQWLNLDPADPRFSERLRVF
jgi:hypothetical protein